MQEDFNLQNSRLLELLFLQNAGIPKRQINSITYTKLIQNSKNFSEFAKKIQERKKWSDNKLTELTSQTMKDWSELSKFPENTGILTSFDPNYPKQFQQLPPDQKPPVIYYKGNPEVLKQKTIAVTGNQKPSDWTKKIETPMVNQILSRTDAVTVGGLTWGCDAISHQAAIDQNKPAIAVLFSGINNIDSPARERLANDIVTNQGLLISEYRPDEPAEKKNFIERDTLIAAISDVVIPIECDKSGGAMHTVDSALNQCKPVLVYLPDKNNPANLKNYAGNRDIIYNKNGIRFSNTLGLISNLKKQGIPVHEPTPLKQATHKPIYTNNRKYQKSANKDWENLPPTPKQVSFLQKLGDTRSTKDLFKLTRGEISKQITAAKQTKFGKDLKQGNTEFRKNQKTKQTQQQKS